MATTYYASAAKSGAPRWDKRPGPMFLYSTFAISAAFVVNDVVRLFKVPKGFRVLGGWIVVPDLDTDGTPAIVLDVGDNDSTADDDRYLAASTVGQAGGRAEFAAVAGSGHKLEQDSFIQLLVDTAPDVGVTSGTIKACLFGTLDE